MSKLKMKEMCGECGVNVVVAWYRQNSVCGSCYNKLKRKGNISTTALSRLNARNPNDF